MITPEQRIARRACLGGSDIACAFTGKFGGLSRVIFDKRGPTAVTVPAEPAAIEEPDEADNLLIEHGNWSEGPGLEWFKKQQNCDLFRNIRVAHNSPGSPIAVNLDGLIPEKLLAVQSVANGMLVGEPLDPAKAIGIPVEHKYVSSHAESDWTRETPNDYTLVQVHTEMLCCEADHAWVVVTLYWKCRFAIRVPRNEALCAAIDKYARWIWDTYVQTPVMPSMDFAQLPDAPVSRQLRDALNSISIEKGKIIELDERDLRTVQLMDTAKEAGTAFTRGANALSDWMKLRMEDAEIGRLPDGTELIRKFRQRKGFPMPPAEWIELQHKTPKAPKEETPSE